MASRLCNKSATGAFAARGGADAAAQEPPGGGRKKQSEVTEQPAKGALKRARDTLSTSSSTISSTPASTLAADFAAPFRQWRTWFLMANQDVRLRYKRSVIGPFWISLTLVATILGIGLLYSLIFRQEFVSFLTFFACGILAWNFLSTLLSEGVGAVVEADHHLRSVPIRMTVLSSRTVYRNLLIFGHNALVVLVMLVLFGHQFSLTAFLAIPGIFAYVLLGFFWTVTMAPLATRFRDIPQVVTSILQMMFFLTPIFWRPEFISERPVITEANPFYHLLEIIRAPLLGDLPTATNWAVTLAIVAFLGALAAATNGYTRKRIFLWL